MHGVPGNNDVCLCVCVRVCVCVQDEYPVCWETMIIKGQLPCGMRL